MEVAKALQILRSTEGRSAEAVNMRDRFTGLNPQDVIMWAERIIREEEAVVAVNETVKAWPLDGALAVWKAARKLFGWTEMRDIPGIFGDRPPVEVAVEVSLGEYEKIPWGGLAMPGIDGTLQFGTGMFEGMPCFVLQGKVKRKSLRLVTTLMDEARRIVAEESIYKGKALIIEPKVDPNFDDKRVSVLLEPPQFFKLNGIDKKDLVLPEATFRQVNTAVFSMIEDNDLIAADGLPTKRTIVLNGKPGTGKTLTMTIGAKLCVVTGRTFILLKDIEYLEDTIKIASIYNMCPALIAAEDIDRRMETRDDQANKLLNAIDGVDSKNLDIQFLLTTNHKEKLIETFQRAGRSDWIIDLPVPDAYASAELLRRYSTDDFKVNAEEYMAIGKILAEAGTLPANIAEVARRARYYKIAERSKKIDASMLKVVALQVIEEKRIHTEERAVQTGALERIEETVKQVREALVQ